MSITDLIVDLLRQGKQVELPGVGTFGSAMQPPRHDAATGTYFPSSRTLTFTTATSGDTSIVQALSEHECVGENVASQMWKNYMDALTDKLARSGNHAFGELGVLQRSADGEYSFAMAEGAVLTTGNERPLEGVKTYAHSAEADPFARFEAGAAEAEAKRKAEEEAARLAEEAERKAAEERAEAERIAAAQKAEAERKAAEEKAEAERIAAEQKAEAERKVAEEKAEAERKAADERAEAERKAEEERIAALAALEQKADNAKCNKREDEGKKKSKWWLWLLLLLLLLLIGGGAYYYFAIYRPAHPASSQSPSSAHLTNVPVTNDLTYNTDLLEYSPNEVKLNRDRVCQYMSDYIYSFLAYRHYTSAQVPMMERVHAYAGDRLTTLMADRFAVQRLIPHNDYVYNHCEAHLRDRFAQRQRYVVQGELLNMPLLDSLLNVLIDELGLQPDAAPAPQVAVATAKPTTAAPAPTEQTARVSVEQNSRQGFDIIAGFYIDRAKAARMTARLHDLGSDAYIIEKNNMFYVSMGSAKTRTAADALFKHIKSWYDGDVVIKEW